MPIGLTNAPTTIMDHINRVLGPIWTSCGVAHTCHFNIVQGQRNTLIN